MIEDDRDYFASNVIPDANGCWIWQGSLMGKGYGPHRKSYEAFKGPIPEGLIVRHTCDIMPCINPKHLIVGTHADNMQDCIERGRFVAGKGGCAPTYSDELIAEVRQMSADGHGYSFIVEYTGISKGYISKIINGQFRNKK